MTNGDWLVVEWWDIRSLAGWQDPSKLPPCALCVTTGYLVLLDDNELRVAATRVTNPMQGETDTVSDTSTIPIGAVKQIWLVTEE